jgi:enoyl-CoA hydratase
MGAVDYTTEGHVATITINRPEARNAVNSDVANGIEDAIDSLEGDESVWLAILTGVPPVFCAGADLNVIAAGELGSLSTKRGGFGGIVARERTKPVIAAVDGPALAGGTEIALACDLIVASSNANFGLPEVKRSLVAAAGGLFRLPRRIPFNVAMELALTGDAMDATRAHHLGLVNHLCEPGEALATAADLARRIEANAPVAVRETRKVIYSAMNEDEATGWRLSYAGMSHALASEDSKEGLRAFIEKRPPNWTGR